MLFKSSIVKENENPKAPNCQIYWTIFTKIYCIRIINKLGDYWQIGLEQNMNLPITCWSEMCRDCRRLARSRMIRRCIPAKQGSEHTVWVTEAGEV